MKKAPSLYLASSIVLLASLARPQAATPQHKTAVPPLKETILQRERATWETIQKKSYKAFADLLTADYVAIDNTGMAGRSDTLKAVTEMILNDFSMQDVRVRKIANGVALITYKVKVRGSYQGKEYTRPIFAASVWVKQGGKWLCAYNQETEAP